jgi:hypothetical protein
LDFLKGSIPDIYGVPVLTSKLCLEEQEILIKMCRSKKKRIKKKWLKNLKNYKVEMKPACYMMGNKILMHPDLMQSIKAAAELHTMNCSLDNIRMVV